MIYGIGTDIVRIQRLVDILQRYGERFARRILADDEMQEFQVSNRKSHFLAKRFAAKEAFVKAIGTGFRNGISLRDIRVTHDDLGKPLLTFSTRLDQRLGNLGIDGCHLSLSDEQDYAIAFVTLERR